MRAALWHQLPRNFEAQLDAAIRAGLTAFHFDDGYEDILRAGKALEERGLRGTFFIVPGWLGLPGQATGGDVRRLYERGHIIGNHTMNHLMLTKVPRPVAEREVEAGQRALTTMTDTTRKPVAWPYGMDPHIGVAGRGITKAEVEAYR